MLKTIIAATLAYLATSIDEIPVLFMLYTKSDNKGKGKIITAGYFAGTLFIILLSFMCAFGLGRIPDKWLVGLAGLLPLIMGIRILIKGENESDEEETMQSAMMKKTLFAQMIAITVGLGIDDLTVYIPLFTTLANWEILIMILVFLIGTAFLCLISHQLTRITKLTEFIEKRERYVIGIVFILLGIYVLYECGTISKIF